MKRSAKVGIIAGLALAVPFALLAPALPSRKKRAEFDGRNFAHRGLHTPDKAVPENSLAAFGRAADAGYGMELDVQLSRDGLVVVFHDDTLNRVCGVDARVDALDFDELRGLSLCGTAQRIPLLGEVLELLDGRTPLIVELKTGPRNKELCEKTLALLRTYKGPVCIESFNPFIVAWFRFHAPWLLRGQLAQPPVEYEKAGFPKWKSLLLGNTLFNCAARPDFIAYKIGPRPLSVRFAELLGAMRFGWTSHDPTSERGRDAVIFEFYRPESRYKKK